MLSVIIPTLNAASHLPACLECIVVPGGVVDVVVVDGGSRDDTVALAQKAGARVIEASPGRGGQLRAGAAAAIGEWLLFLHADTRLAPDWAAAVRRNIDGLGDRRAAAFRLELDDSCKAARRIERLAGWRARWFGLPYGDQGMLISRGFYDALGGFRPLPLMEDVDLARRIGRRRWVFFDVAAVTSAARYRRGGYWLRPIRNLCCLGLFLAGAPIALIQRLYGR